MKILKKISILLAVAAAVLFTHAFAQPGQAAAAISPKQQIKNCIGSLQLTDIAHITCNDGLQKITFTDNNPTDNGVNKDNYAPPDKFSGNLFCPLGDINSNGSQAVTEPNVPVGLTLVINHNLTSADKNKSLEVDALLSYRSGNDCIPYATKTSTQTSTNTGRPQQSTQQTVYTLPDSKNVRVSTGTTISKLLQWDGNTLTSLDGVNGGSLSGQNFSRPPVLGEDPGGKITYVLLGSQDFDAGKCQGSVIAVDKDGNPAVEFDIGKSGSTQATSIVYLARLLHGDSCYVTRANYGLGWQSFTLLGSPSPALKIDTSGTPGQPAGSSNSNTPSPSSDNGSGSTEATCESASSGLAGAALSFAMCPAIEAAQSATDGLTGQIENFLAFNASNSLNGSQAKVAWANIRDLASAFLVIIMLVMVLSQAISWGPFDAYTVKKVLPRLIIAVIFMQLSWSLLIYVFGIINDLGRGVADLLYQPFGGADAVTIGKALANGGVSTTAAGTISWVAVLAVGAIAILSIPTLALAAWSIVVALVTGFIVLIFRQILLIACLIFAPLALLCWILPGTQKYWKLWYDNLSKALLMFPMITGMLAAGKIFAMITGSASKSNFLLNFIFVIIGFYGPYFLLPKTYKWGGQAMAMAGQGIATGMQHTQGPVGNWLKGQQERSRWHLARETRKGELMRRAKAGFAEGLTTGSAPRRMLNRSRLLGLYNLNPRAEADVNRKLVRTAQAQAEEELNKRGKEAVDPLIQQNAYAGPRDANGRVTLGERGQTIADLAVNGEDHEQEAAIGALIQGRKWEELEAVTRTQRGREGLQRTLNKRGELAGTLSEGRADLAPWNSGRTPVGVAAGDVDPSTGQARPGLTPAQIITQHQTFWRGMASNISTASPQQVNNTHDMLQYVARDPRALQLINGPAEQYINVILAEYARRNPNQQQTTLRQLIEQQRTPPQNPPRPQNRNPI